MIDETQKPKRRRWPAIGLLVIFASCAGWRFNENLANGEWLGGSNALKAVLYEGGRVVARDDFLGVSERGNEIKSMMSVFHGRPDFVTYAPNLQVICGDHSIVWSAGRVVVNGGGMQRSRSENADDSRLRQRLQDQMKARAGKG